MKKTEKPKPKPTPNAKPLSGGHAPTPPSRPK